MISNNHKQVIHIFNARNYHLAPDIIESFIMNIELKHFFILIADKGQNINWTIYYNLFEKYNFENFVFSRSLSELKKNDDIRKDAFIVMHGDSFKRMLFFYLRGFSNFHWVCWGSGLKNNKTLKSFVSKFVKEKIYKRFKSIVLLNQQDEIELVKRYEIKNTSILTYPMKLYEMDYFKKERIQIERKGLGNSVYLGNNPACINSYLTLIEELKKYKNLIRVNCMLNYEYVKNSKYFSLIEKGKSNFESNFKANTKFYDLKDYPTYMDQCDIYICGEKRQTGLAAIYTTLKLGKKLFLDGNNYDFIKSLGCKVFKVSEIGEMLLLEFLQPLEVKEKEQNFDIIFNYLSPDKILSEWETFFNENI